MPARLICTVCIPLLMGSALYFFPTTPFLKNYLADGFWAFALVSLLCIIWNNKVPKVYILLAFLIAAGFELGQWQGFIKGTGDLIDLFVYNLFGGAAYLLNSFVSKPTLTDNESQKQKLSFSTGAGGV